MRKTAAFWINHLNLSEHIEGGAYRRIYASDLVLGKDQLPSHFNGERPICTSIYFLLQQGQISRLHRIASDETWHFYFGDPLIIHEIQSDGKLRSHLLGQDPIAGQLLQTTVKAGSWFGAIPAPGSEYALTGCTVSPGFDFEEFELAERSMVLEKFPQHADIIDLLCNSR